MFLLKPIPIRTNSKSSHTCCIRTKVKYLPLLSPSISYQSCSCSQPLFDLPASSGHLKSCSRLPEKSSQNTTWVTWPPCSKPFVDPHSGIKSSSINPHFKVSNIWCLTYLISYIFNHWFSQTFSSKKPGCFVPHHSSWNAAPHFPLSTQVLSVPKNQP